MERKYIYFIVGIIAVIVTTGGIAGGLASVGDIQKNDMRITMIILSFTPANIQIEIQCDTSWTGDWAIGTDGGSESGGAGTTVHTGIGDDASVTCFISNLVGGSLTLRIYINGLLACTKSASIFKDNITCTAHNPYKTLFYLAFLI